MFNRIKTKYLWISIAISLVMAVGLLVGVTFVKEPWTTVMIVVLAIIFIYMTFAIQIASTRTFRYKGKKINYQTKEYEIKNDDFSQMIKDKGYKPRVVPYGISYIKINKTDAYKIVIINDKEKYFNISDDEQSKQTPEKDLEKCKRFIGFEIFIDYDEEVLSKLVDFNIQGNNIYYAGLYKSENKLICPNFVEPNEIFNDLYGNILNDLDIEINDEV